MKYEKPSFNVAVGDSKKYRDEHDRIFARPKKKKDGLFFELEGAINILERKKGVETREPINGEVVLKLLIMVLETELDRIDRNARGAKKRKATDK